MKTTQVILAALFFDSTVGRGGGVGGNTYSARNAEEETSGNSRISNYYQSNPDYGSYGISRWYNEHKVTEAISNVSPYVTIFGGEVSYRNTITLEEKTITEDGNLWIGAILLVVFTIAVFFLTCMVNQCQFLMGCCYDKKELRDIGKEDYFIGKDTSEEINKTSGETKNTSTNI